MKDVVLLAVSLSLLRQDVVRLIRPGNLCKSAIADRSSSLMKDGYC